MSRIFKRDKFIFPCAEFPSILKCTHSHMTNIPSHFVYIYIYLHGWNLIPSRGKIYRASTINFSINL